MGRRVNQLGLVLETKSFHITDGDQPQVAVLPTQTSCVNKRLMFGALGSPAR